MEFNDILAYRKEFFNYLLSNIDSFNNVYKSSVFAQGFAKWYLSNFVAGDVRLAEEMIVCESFSDSEGGYLVFTRSGSDLSFYVFSAPEQCGQGFASSATGLRSDMFAVSGNYEFCQSAIETILNSGMSATEDDTDSSDADAPARFSLSVCYVTLSDTISLHVKRSLRKCAVSLKGKYRDAIATSSASFVVKNDIIRRFSNLMVAKSTDNYNVLGLFKSIVKSIESFADDVFFGKHREAKLIFMSMVSGVDATIISRGDDSLIRILEQNIAMYFADRDFSGHIKYMSYDPKMFDRGSDAGFNGVSSSVFYIPNRRMIDEGSFSKMIETFPDLLAGNVTSRPINKLDLVYLREKAKRVGISPEIRFFLFEAKNKFDNLELNSVNSKYEVPDSAWIAFSMLFRISAALSMRKEVDYSDVVLLENAACSFAADKTGDDRWVSRLIRDLLKTSAFMPLRLETMIPMGGDGMLEFDADGRSESDSGNGADEGVYINDLHGSHLEVKLTDVRISFRKDDCLYSFDDAMQIFEKNEQRLMNLSKKYATSLKRANYYTHKFDADILNAISLRMGENSVEKAKLEKLIKNRRNG